MNKLTKVGCSALCGSLAAISAANAGDLTVTGGADLTYLSIGAETTGNPIGMGSNINFKGSGELDNGWTFSVTTAIGNAAAFSAANISLTMGGAGTINFNQGNSGNGIKALDDKMPTAWEEAWGAGLNPGIKLVCGSCLSNNVMYSTPKMAGTTFTFTLAPDYGSSDTADKATSNTEDNSGSSYDATININPTMGTELLSGLNFFAGASTIESYNNSATEEDQYQAVGGITFDIGPVSLGWQVSGLSLGEQSSATTYNAYKNQAFGISFNVNDDLSLSYGKHTTRKAGYNNSNVQSGEGTRRVEVKSLQAAYSMGGASIAIASSESTNHLFVNAATRNATTLSLGLAF